MFTIRPDDDRDVFVTQVDMYKDDNVSVAEVYAGRSKNVSMSDIILDNAAQASIFGNSDLLSNIQSVDDVLNFRGIHGKGKSCSVAGTFQNLVSVYFDKDLDVNILSFSDAKRSGRMSYDDITDIFTWRTEVGDFQFVPKKDMYVWSST